MKDIMNVFSIFDKNGKLVLPKGEVDFCELTWNAHPVFDGVELKHLVTGSESDGLFSYHLVKIAPGKKIGIHTHEKQLETHEVIYGSGICINDGAVMDYEAGIISILQKNKEHEVVAGNDGLYLFAKFIPALL